MRKPIQMLEREQPSDLDSKKLLEEVQEDLFTYLQSYRAEEQGFSKHAIMGPVGKLLPQVLAQRFGDNVDAYVGYVANIHRQQTGYLPSVDSIDRLRNAVTKLLRLKHGLPEREFVRAIETIDYGVFEKKAHLIMELSQRKKEADSEVKQHE